MVRHLTRSRESWIKCVFLSRLCHADRPSRDIHSTTGKLRRAVLQFTPVNWVYVRWMDPNSTTMRIIAVWILIVAWQLIELNTFFIKHIFFIPPSHMLNLIRLLLICLISAPTIRQYYVYVTDTRCKRVGTQLWVFCAILLTESIICIKFGLQMFRQTLAINIITWLCIQMIGSFVCIYLCALFAERWNKWKHFHDADSPIRVPRNVRPSASPLTHSSAPGDSTEFSRSLPAGKQDAKKAYHIPPTELGQTPDLATLELKLKGGNEHISAKTNSLISGHLTSNGLQLRSRSSAARPRIDRNASSSPKFRSGINGSI